MNEAYQVVYCDVRQWENPSANIAFTQWHLLDCPLIGIQRLKSARSSALQLKKKYRTKIEVLIIGSLEAAARNADWLFGIHTLRGANAQQNSPIYVFEREETMREIDELRENSGGIQPVRSFVFLNTSLA
jgi:hypothetical protein